MPTIRVQGKKISCEKGANLRQVLLANNVDLYNGGAKIINCQGFGSCGTCAVQVEGKVSEPTWKDKTRLSLPPHSPTKNLRLACQTQVLGNVKVTKFQGFWGQKDEVI